MNKELSRQDQIVRTGFWGIGVNLLVSAGKAAVGFVSGSMAIVMDAVNNLTDILSSALTIIGVKLAGRPADDKHPFGYGRIEYFTAVIIALLILVAGGTSLLESIKGILHPEPQEYSLVSFLIITFTLLMKYFLGVYTKRQGKRLHSDSLVSSGSECIYDCIVSVATIVSAVLMVTLGWNVDSWLAAIIACLIIKVGLEMLISPINELLGLRNDPELTSSIKARVREAVPGVRGVYDVVLHNYGPEQNIGALHVEVDDTLAASHLHHMTRQIQQVVRHDFGLFVTVGFYAHHKEGTESAAEEAVVRQHVMQQDGVLGMHGFYVNHQDRLLSFDIVYSFRLSHPITLRTQVTEWLRQHGYADHEIMIGLDRNYSN